MIQPIDRKITDSTSTSLGSVNRNYKPIGGGVGEPGVWIAAAISSHNGLWCINKYMIRKFAQQTPSNLYFEYCGSRTLQRYSQIAKRCSQTMPVQNVTDCR